MVLRAVPWGPAPRFARWRLLACALLLSWASSSGVAWCAQSAGDRVAAEALYNDGLRLLETGELEAACLKLEESQRLDPGLGALLYLGECYRQLGRIASAWATFRDAAYRAREAGDEREAVALELAEAMKSKLSYLTIEVPSDPTPGLKVERDGKLIGRALWGTAIPVDPGVHQVAVSAPGFETWTKTVTVDSDAVRHSLRVPPLQAQPGQPALPIRHTASPSSAGRPRVIPWVLIGVGAAGLAGATVLSVKALSTDNEADDNCRRDDPSLCNPTGRAAGRRAADYANAAGLSAMLGGVALASGLAWWLLGQEDSGTPTEDGLAVGAAIGAGELGLSLHGVW